MFSGLITALVTPFDEKGAIDWHTFSRLIERQLEAGVDGLVIGGTTGEGPTLEWEELTRMLTLAVEIAGDQLYIIANIGTNNTRQTALRAMEAKQIGVSAGLVIVPYYNKPCQEGVYQHFAAVSGADLPLILYHHPGRTGITLEPETIDRIMELETLIAIKDSSGDSQLAARHPTYCGLDLQLREYLEAGAIGTISVIGNLLPDQCHHIVHNRDYNLLGALTPLLETLELEVNPQAIKCAMEIAGLCLAKTRLPLISAAPSTQAALTEKLHALQATLI